MIDYNHIMGEVDLKDQFLHMYMVESKTKNQWYIKLFKRLLSSTVFNSFVINLQVTGGNKKTALV